MRSLTSSMAFSPQGAGPVRGAAQTESDLEATLLLARERYPELMRSSISGGGPIGELEAEFRRVLGVPRALALSSGTAALHVALLACGARAGDEVIVSAYDWGAATAAVLAAGAVPVFADIDPETYTLSPSSVEDRLTSRTAAIVVTHLLGQPADMDALMGLARLRGLRVVEDCAHALGATRRGRPAGTIGDAGCFSLGPGKPLEAGEGGVLVTGSEEVFEQAVRLSQHPVRQLREGLEPDHFSLNHRINPLAAMHALVGLEGVEGRVPARREAAERLGRVLEGVPGIRPPRVAKGGVHAFYRYSPTFVAGEWGDLSRGQVVEALCAEGLVISEGPIGEPLPRRLAASRPGTRFGGGSCPVAERRCDEGELVMALPEAGAGARWPEEIGEALLRVQESREVLRCSAEGGARS